MTKNRKYPLVILGSLLTVSILVYSCRKDEVTTGITVIESYVNKAGQGMKITRYMKNQPAKSFDIANDDTLSIESSGDAGTDTTGTLYRADSAVVVFDDGKTYYMTDTTNSNNNFLTPKRTISPSGKTHYYRYTFTMTDYGLAK